MKKTLPEDSPLTYLDQGEARLPSYEDPIVLYRDGGRLVARDPSHDGLANAISELPAYAGHEAVFIARGPVGGIIFMAFVHDTTRGRALGGVREVQYDSMADAVSDGLRLAEGMTLKSAMAEIHYGGGKGIIARVGPEGVRQTCDRVGLYQNFGRFVAGLGGYYITAEDVGNSVEDMRAVLSTCRHVSCLPEDVGGGGDPSPYTARGTFLGIQASLEARFGDGDPRGRRVLIEGAGKVATEVALLLHASGAEVVACDVNPAALNRLARLIPNLATLTIGVEFFSADGDVLAPCALGGSISKSTIPLIRCPIICGAANNQLREPVGDGNRKLTHLANET